MERNILRIFLFILLGVSYVVASMAVAAPAPSDTRIAFSKGSSSIGVVAGSGRSFNSDYIILGAGIGYYLIDGLELGADVQHWFSGNPSITKFSPQIRYVYATPKVLQPYLGAFYKWTFIEDMDNQASYGYRVGAYFSTRNKLNIGGGFVYEKYKSCALFVNCSNTYPEVLLTINY